MTKAPPTLTNPDAGVMATRPATAPLAAPTILGFPVKIQLIPIQLNAAIAVAVLVTTKALVARVPAMTALPAFLWMWLVMTAATMFPSVLPTAILWTRLTARTTYGLRAIARHTAFVCGYVLAWLSGRNARLLIIGLPALLVALSVLSGLWQDAGREAAEPAPAPEVVAR